MWVEFSEWLLISVQVTEDLSCWSLTWDFSALSGSFLLWEHYEEGFGAFVDSGLKQFFDIWVYANVYLAQFELGYLHL